ncbi:MAG: tetratricopeptide (TPR) repeat protein [Cryomorphaceae bacterium]|jgi:tetratricopeptide (TPR) repeat protein
MMRNLPLIKIISVLAIACSLGACTGVPKSSNSSKAGQYHADAILELAADQKEGGLSDNQLNADLDLPSLELDAQTLEQLLVANLASYEGRWDQATNSSLMAAESTRDPRIARIATLLGLRKSDYEAAAQAAILWAELSNSSDDSLNMLIIAQTGAGQVDGAIDALAKHRKDKDLDRHVRQAAGLLVRQRNQGSALEIAQHYVDTYPDSAQVMISMAYVAETFKKLEIATQWVDMALSMNPGWDLAAQMKANMLRRQDKAKERGEFIAQYVATYPKSVAMRINHAAELAREEKYQQALDLMHLVLKDAPRDTSALSYAAALAMQLGNKDLAKKYYTKALYQDPKDDDVRWSLARIAVAEEQYAKAERLYNDISSEENYINAQLQVASMRYQTQGIKTAINTLRALEPDTEEQYIEIALTRHYLLMQDHQYEEAFGYVNETLIYLPDNQDLVYARALVAAELNKVEIAEADFKVIIGQKPDHANALNALGYTLADQTDRYAEALEYIERALAVRPNDAHILDSRGWVAYRMGDFATAVEFLERAFAANSQVEIAAHLGEVLWESGEQQKANQIWQESFAQDANNPILNKTLEKYGVSFTANVD